MTDPVDLAADDVLRSLFGRTDREVALLQARFIGRWARVSAVVKNLYREDPSADVSVFAVRSADPRAALLDAGFMLRFSEAPDKEEAGRLERRTTVRVRGRIDECAEGLLVLSRCRFQR